jgi:hypothetical protein
MPRARADTRFATLSYPLSVTAMRGRMSGPMSSDVSNWVLSLASPPPPARASRPAGNHRRGRNDQPLKALRFRCAKCGHRPRDHEQGRSQCSAVARRAGVDSLTSASEQIVYSQFFGSGFAAILSRSRCSHSATLSGIGRRSANQERTVSLLTPRRRCNSPAVQPMTTSVLLNSAPSIIPVFTRGDASCKSSVTAQAIKPYGSVGNATCQRAICSSLSPPPSCHLLTSSTGQLVKLPFDG